jgi:hypothetical protein
MPPAKKLLQTIAALGGQHNSSVSAHVVAAATVNVKVLELHAGYVTYYCW